MWTAHLAYVTALPTKPFWGWIRVAKPFWLRLLANGPGSSEALRDTVLAASLGGGNDGVGQELYRFFHRAGPAGQRSFAIPDPAAIASDFDADARAHALQTGAGQWGPERGAGADGQATVSVVVDWPWQIAVGLAPITPEWQDPAQRQPTGWLEPLLAQNALASPLLVEFSADSLAGAVENPPFWADAARSGRGLSAAFSAGFTLTATSFDVDRITLDTGSDYNLAVSDDLVAAGGRLVIEAGALGDGDH